MKCFTNHTARVTLPERKQREHTLTLLGVPLTTALTRMMLGFHVLFDLLCEWETLIPKETLFPQYSHFAICRTSFFNIWLQRLILYMLFTKKASVFCEFFKFIKNNHILTPKTTIFCPFDWQNTHSVVDLIVNYGKRDV